MNHYSNGKSIIKFSNDNAMIVVMHDFKKATFFLNGEPKDEFTWDEDTKMTAFNDWVQSKRNGLEK